jgi:hypothetical protein
MKDILFSVLSAGSFWDRTYGPEAYTRPAHCRTAEAGQQTLGEATVGARGNGDCRDCDFDAGVAVLRAHPIESPRSSRATGIKEPATTPHEPCSNKSVRIYPQHTGVP